MINFRAPFIIASLPSKSLNFLPATSICLDQISKTWLWLLRMIITILIVSSSIMIPTSLTVKSLRVRPHLPINFSPRNFLLSQIHHKIIKFPFWSFWMRSLRSPIKVDKVMTCLWTIKIFKLKWSQHLVTMLTKC